MKPIKKKRGIILKTQDFKDSSKIITILSSEGLNRLILKGANKMNSGTKKYTIVPLEVEYLMAESASISTFTEGYIINNYINIKSNYEKNLIAMVIIEKVLTFTDHIDNKDLFYEFVKKTFELLDQYEYGQVVLSIFETKLLYLIGIAPNLNTCGKCKTRSDEMMLSVSLGGATCLRCSGMINCELNLDQTKVFKYIYLIKLDKIDEKFLNLISTANINFNDFLDAYYEKYIDFHSKAKKIIKKIS